MVVVCFYIQLYQTGTGVRALSDGELLLFEWLLALSSKEVSGVIALMSPGIID